MNSQSEGCAFARSGHTKVRDLWNQEAQDWKNLSDLRMHFHASNRASKDIILESIPRWPDSFSSLAQPDDWISNIAPRSGALLEWVYYMLESLPDKVLVLEFRKVSTSGQLRATSHQKHSLLLDNHTSVRVLSQERHGATLKIARNPPSASQRNTTY